MYRMPAMDSADASLREGPPLDGEAALKFARTRPAVNREKRPHGVRLAASAALLIALLVLVLATAAAALRRQPFYGWYYHWAWYSTLLALGGGYALRAGRWPGTLRLAGSLLFWSAPLWFVFELINLRLANWYYVFASVSRPERVLGAFAAFATVLPAIYLAYRWVERLGVACGWTGPRLPLCRFPAWLVAAGTAFLVLALWRPALFFPLVWGFMTLVLEPWNYRKSPDRSLIGDLEYGRYGRIVQLLIAGAGIGLLWELFNSLAGTRWIYTVPGLEGSKLFEMPLPGFLGFPVLALDCFVAYQALVNAGLAVPGWERWRRAREERSAPRGGAVSATASVGRSRRQRWLTAGAAGSAAVLFGVGVAVAMERWTMDSTYPAVESLPELTAREGEVLRAAGLSNVESLAASSTEQLIAHGLGRERAEAIVEMARLVSLRGLGAVNAAGLGELGIRNVCALARSDPGEVAAAVRSARGDPRAGSLPRVRVWMRSAARTCPE